MNSTKASWIIFGLTFISGSTFLISKNIVSEVDPLTLMSLRFSIASIALFLIMTPRLKNLNLTSIYRGAIIGCFLAAGIYFLLLGIKSSDSGKAAFIVDMDVVLIPVLMFFLFRKKPERRLVIGIICAVFGLGLLTIHEKWQFEPRDLWLVASALGFSFFGIFNSRFAQKDDPIILGVVQTFTVAILTTIFAILFESYTFPRRAVIWEELIYLGIVTTAFRFSMQCYAQKFVSASRMALIYFFEPVVALAVGAFIGREIFTSQQFVGCGFILFGMMIAQFRFFKLIQAL